MVANNDSLDRYFLDYQRRAIASEARLVLWEKSIRVGATFAMAFRAVRNRMRPGGGNYLHTSVNERIAKSFVHDCKKFCRVYEAVFNAKVEESEIDERSVYNPVTDRQESAYEIFFKATGNKIMAFSSNPDALRGEGGDVGIDEICSHRDPEAMMQAAGGRAMWGNSVYVWSSHQGADSMFARKLREEKAKGINSRWHIWSLDLYQAIEAGLLDKINQVSGLKMSREDFIADTKAMVGGEDAFAEECLLQPRSSGGYAIRWEFLDAMVEDFPCERWDLKGDDAGSFGEIADAVAHLAKGGKVWIGYDVARTGHLSAVPFLFQDGDRRPLKALVTMQGMKFGRQREMIEKVMRKVPAAAGLGDATGLGMQVNEELAEKFGDHRWKGVNFSALKPELGTQLVRSCEDGLIPLPGGRENEDIVYDLRGLRTDKLPSGRVKFTESANPVEKRSHCDIAWAIALANMAAGEESGCGIDFYDDEEAA